MPVDGYRERVSRAASEHDFRALRDLAREDPSAYRAAALFDSNISPSERRVMESAAYDADVEIE